MESLICKNSVHSVMGELQEYLQKGGIIGGIRMIDSCDEQVVLLVDSEPIEDKIAQAWWNGFQAFLQQ